MSTSCIFCNSDKYSNSSYPKNNFNNKTFSYITCHSCDLTYLNPLPIKDDYDKMYPTSYQSNKVATDIQENWYQKLPGLRFDYGYQFDLIKKYVGNNATILDYGCGTGHFILNATKAGFKCDGAEYNPDYVALLKRDLKNIGAFTIDEVLNGSSEKKYDVIRLSNVLEHLTDPNQIISILTKRLTPKGILLVEGPIEHNFSIAQAFRDIYFKIGSRLNPERTVVSPPYHIFLSDYKNQRSFFQRLNLEELHYSTDEETWPFPPSFREAIGFRQKVMAIVGKVSVKITKILQNNWGNIFVYVGRNSKSI